VWVYKKTHSYKYLPRRQDGPKEFDYTSNQVDPENFPEKMEGEPPKLWLAWIYRSASGEPHWTKKWLEKLFGKNFQPGEMAIFKNTPSQNRELWRVKHMIEIRPLIFPNGEPTMDDINSLEVFADGRCIIDKRLACDPAQLQIMDSRKQLSSGYLSFRLKQRYDSYKDIFEDNVYTPSNISVLD
ncbi:unnamed protein product, partial [Dracunculus medinensis]|uniref:39S ribosomal protein L30, mitochondrial n=1 Tax=Dracunculus medinensis TaxID=318479 RepID=A0A0N4U1Q2_DRAME